MNRALALFALLATVASARVVIVPPVLPVPEPQTNLLIGAGLMLIGYFGVRNKQKRS